MSFVFAGYPSYLVEAGRKLDLPAHVVDRARRDLNIGHAAGLLSQATTAHPAARREILAHARERIDALKVAWAAAEAMYDEVHASLFPPEESVPSADEDLSNQPSRRGRKGTHS